MKIDIIKLKTMQEVKPEAPYDKITLQVLKGSITFGHFYLEPKHGLVTLQHVGIDKVPLRGVLSAEVAILTS